jgi:hypothetical protein
MPPHCRKIQLLAASALGFAWLLTIAAAGQVPSRGADKLFAPRIVSQFVDKTSAKNHFFENMYRPVQLPDGRIMALSVVGRLKDATMQGRYSRDDGQTWSSAEDLFHWPTAAAKYYTFEAMVDHTGELHVFLLCDDAIWHTRTEAGRSRWQPAKTIYKGEPGNFFTAVELRNGRIVLPFPLNHKRSWSERGGEFLNFTYVGPWGVSSLYSDDAGTTWKQSPDDLSVQTPDLGTWGADEPSAIELKDGRLWMLIRTQRGRLYESFSSDGGARWSSAKPSPLISSDSPAGLLRLKDGRILLFSNACLRYPYAYGARNVLHVAISEDEGRTWRGFREVARDPLRGDPPDAEGDYGLAYTFPIQTADGHVLFTNWVESGRTRSFRLFDPAWVYETKQTSDFARGIDDWTVFGTKGVGVEPDAEANKTLVLAIRKADKDWPAGAVWNFPVGGKGRLQFDLKVRRGFGGALIGLTDHYSVPWDMEDQYYNIFDLHIAGNGQTSSGAKFVSGRWHHVILDWETSRRQCRIFIDGKPAGTIEDNRHSEGINYLRVRSLSDGPDDGLLLRTVTADVSASWPVPSHP